MYRKKLVGSKSKGKHVSDSGVSEMQIDGEGTADMRFQRIRYPARDSTPSFSLMPQGEHHNRSVLSRHGRKNPRSDGQDEWDIVGQMEGLQTT